MNSDKEPVKLSLDELEQLARQPSQENWATLVAGLTEHFLNNDNAQSQRCRELFGEVMCRLLDQAALETRESLSRRVATRSEIPSQVIKQLASDDYSVAGPVLESSPVLSDSDLIAIARTMVSDHRLSISRRAALGSRLTAFLVQANEPEVIQELAGNAGARFSESTYRIVAERAKRDEKILEKLVERDDITPVVSVQIAPFLSEELKKKLHKHAGQSEEKGLLDSLSELTSEQTSRKDPVSTPQELAELVHSIKAGEVDISDIVAELADQEYFSGVVKLLAALAELPDKSVRAAMLNINGMPISVICKALGISQDSFEAVSHLRCEQMRMPHAELITQTDRYSQLNVEEARKTLASLQARQRKGNGDAAA